MKDRTFFWFILPTLSAMILFIALPIVSVFVQSLHIQHEQVLVVSESCGPFGCEETSAVDQEATRALREAQPLGKFNSDPPIFLGLTTSRDSFSSHLDLPVRISHSTIFFSKSTCWKYNICIICGFSKKDILDHQMLKLRKSITSMLNIWVGHCRIFTKNIHPLN